MTKLRIGFSASRRALMTSSAVAGSLALMPAFARGSTTLEVPFPSMRAWLGQLDPQTDRWRSRSWLPENSLSSDALRVVVRGPWRLDTGRPEPGLAVGVLYRGFEAYPFQLGDPASGHGGIVLHAEPGSLAALQFGHGDAEPLNCALTTAFHPRLLPGSYLVLIDESGRMTRPDWSAIKPVASADCPISCQPGSRNATLVALTLNVSAA
jgi:hypothetical protein